MGVFLVDLALQVYELLVKLPYLLLLNLHIALQVLIYVVVLLKFFSSTRNLLDLLL